MKAFLILDPYARVDLKDTMREQLIKDRRALHQIPEVGFNCPQTKAYIKNRLQEMDCEVI